MPTPFSYVYIIFQSQISDAVFNGLLVKDELSKQYLINSITNFRRCKQNLDDRDDANDAFNIDLTQDEKQILGNLMVIEYLSSQIVTIDLIKQGMSNRDFQMTSQAAHLEKLLMLQEKREKKVSKMIIDYTYNVNDLTKLK